MRTPLLALTALLACTPAALAQAPDAETHRYKRAALAVTLPAGFALEQALEEHLPDTAVYLFVDHTSGQTLSVELHTYFSPEQRAGWLAGERAGSDLAHLDAVERADPSAFPLGAGAAYRFAMSEDGAQGVALYGCEEARCYRATVTGPSEGFDAATSDYAALFGGIRFGE